MKSAGLIFGRMNPITKGHMILIDKLNSLNVDDKMVYLSHSQDKKKNPLPYEVKILFVKAMIESKYPNVEVVVSEKRTLPAILDDLHDRGYEKVEFLVGSDRYESFLKMLDSYNTYIPKDGSEPKRFKELIAISVGDERDENASGLASISATKARNYVKEGDFSSFWKIIPTDDKRLAAELFDELEKYLK